jgi:hypothetical protein
MEEPNASLIPASVLSTTCSGNGSLPLHDQADCWTIPAENTQHCHHRSTPFTCVSEMWKNLKFLGYAFSQASDAIHDPNPLKNWTNSLNHTPS